MSEVKHTAGPYKIRFRSEVYAGDLCIADCDMEKSISDAEKLANAKLFAAAPDLLEACRYALYCIVDDGNHGTEFIRAAIAKAEGRS